MGEAKNKTLRDLLLHKLAEPQTEQLEDRILVDSEFAGQLEVEIADLFDDYARKRLSPEDARLVEEHLLTAPGARQRLAFARALAGAQRPGIAAQPETAKRLFLTWRLAIFVPALAACLLLLAFAIAQFRHREQPQSISVESNPGKTIPGSGNHSSTVNPGQQEESAPPFTIVLLASQVRGSETRTFVVPSHTGKLRIQCQIPVKSDLQEFQMVMKDASGHTAGSSENLRAIQSGEINYVEASYPVDQLNPGRYEVAVNSAGHLAHPIASFEFQLRFGTAGR